MTIERRETRFIIDTEAAPVEYEDIEQTQPRDARTQRRALRAVTADERPVVDPGRRPRQRLENIVPAAASAHGTARRSSGTKPTSPWRIGNSRTPRPGEPANIRPAEAVPPADSLDITADRERAARPRERFGSAESPRPTQTLERRRTWERGYRWRLRLTDALLILAATATPSLLILLFSTHTGPLSVQQSLYIFGVPLLVAVVWYLCIGLFRTRESSIIGQGTAEYMRLLQSTGLAFGGLAVGSVITRAEGLRPQVLIALPLGIALLVLGRWLWRRWLLHERSFGHYVSRTIIVGDRTDVQYVIETLHRDTQRGYLVVGAALTKDGKGDLVVDGRHYAAIGSPRSAARVAARLGADTIIVASSDDADPYFVKRLSWQLEGTASELILSSRLTDVAGPRITLRPVDGLPLIQVKIPSFEGGQYALKRTLDIGVSAIALALIAIFALPIALAIKIDSRGPIFFLQERVGRDGHRFKMVKFRTMRVGAEAEVAKLMAKNEGAGPLFKMHNDPRVTRVGTLLRKLSLDELPQFWNVLRGDMSVVGPRPPLPSEVTAYNGAVYRRLYIKPGITGLWQVSGRSDLPWDESVRLDLRYVENWSIMSDLIIMWRTAVAMIRPQGAY